MSLFEVQEMIKQIDERLDYKVEDRPKSALKTCGKELK
jgi:hypothetical protein